MSLGPAGLFPAGLAPVAPTEANRGTLTTARAFDRALGTWLQTIDGSGGWQGMSPTMQRAANLLAGIRRPRFFGADFEARMTNEARRVLKPLIAEGVLQFVGVTAIDDGKATGSARVRVRDLTSGEIETVNL